MSAKTTVKRDVHGLYVRGGGYLFRPVFPSRYPLMGGTDYTEGTKVSVRHKAGSQVGSVGRELWFSHGSYINLQNLNKPIQSEMLWKPDYERWN